MQKTINFRLNRKPVSLNLDSERTLLWVLRTELDLTGTKYGCGEGLCGACTVIIDGEAVRSCQMPISNVDGREIITIEGLSKGNELHPLQKAFVEHDALQCGFCTPGMIMNAYALLLKNPHPKRDEIIAEMDNNFCRCGAHNRILLAIESVS